MSSDKSERRSRTEKLLGSTLEELKTKTAPGEPVYDADNPPMTPEAWNKLVPIGDLPPDEVALILAAFPKTRVRGRQKAPTKVPVSLRLAPDIIEHFKADGPGWQIRMESALRDSMKKAG